MQTAALPLGHRAVLTITLFYHFSRFLGQSRRYRDGNPDRLSGRQGGRRRRMSLEAAVFRRAIRLYTAAGHVLF